MSTIKISFVGGMYKKLSNVFVEKIEHGCLVVVYEDQDNDGKPVAKYFPLVNIICYSSRTQ